MPPHPSLDLKLYDKARGIWQTRMTRGYRLYFTAEQEVATLTDIGPHD